MSDTVDIFNNQQTTTKLQGIIDALDSLQLQLDYQRDQIIDAIGGEPALWSSDGSAASGGVLFGSTVEDGQIESTSNFTADGNGNVEIENSLQIGGGSAIAGATLQVDGSIVVGDASGGTIARLHDDLSLMQKIIVNDTEWSTISTLNSPQLFIVSGYTSNWRSALFFSYFDGGSTMIIEKVAGHSYFSVSSEIPLGWNIHLKQENSEIKARLGTTWSSYNNVNLNISTIKNIW